MTSARKSLTLHRVRWAQINKYVKQIRWDGGGGKGGGGEGCAFKDISSCAK